VIDNIAYFPLQAARNSTPIMEAMLAGLQHRGIACRADSMDADAVILWSVLWAGKMSSNQAVYQHYRKLQRPVIVVDVGALRRGVTWKIALNNVNAQGYYGHKENIDFNRADFLGIRLETVKPTRPEIVIAGQHERSLQLEAVDIKQWTQNLIDRLKSHTDRAIIYRPHPRSKQQLDLSGCEIQIPRRVPNTYDDYDMSWNYHAVINYSSGPGIQAGIHGARLIVSEKSLAHPIAMPLLDIEQPSMLDREQWFREICHTEYTLDEIRQAVWFDRLKKGLT